MAGILRFFHSHRKQLPTYFYTRAGWHVIFSLWAAFAYSQETTRAEGIMPDVSRSIGMGGANNPLFREYLVRVRELPLTETPNSRVIVSVITTESFGSSSVHVLGASTRGLSPQAWSTAKKFWELYFAAAGGGIDLVFSRLQSGSLVRLKI